MYMHISCVTAIVAVVQNEKVITIIINSINNCIHRSLLSNRRPAPLMMFSSIATGLFSPKPFLILIITNYTVGRHRHRRRHYLVNKPQTIAAVNTTISISNVIASI
jgi:hypothetical protein